MARVQKRHASAGPSAADRHRREGQKRKVSYKVILEEVGGKQKKLKTVLYPEQRAPHGYTFIPAGDPQLTNRCKQLAREVGLTVYIVSTSKDLRQGLSREMHRIGYHFPSITVEKACESLGVSLTNSGRVLQSTFALLDDVPACNGLGRNTQGQKKKKAGAFQSPAKFDISLSQAVIDTQAREAIKDLFPKIPAEDLHVIIGRSFQKGKGLVGTANGVSLVRRAQLAVIAHIRHVYTNYDNLLRSVPYMEARRRVEKLCLDHLIQWRGDDENRDNMDDILREVIVIPDDDEDQEAGGQTQEKGRPMHEQFGRDNSVEFISEGDMQTRPVDYSKTNREDSRNDSYSPESDSDVQYIGQGRIAPRPQPAYYQHNLDRMGNHWRRTWEEALDRRRNQPASLYAVDDSPSILTSRGFRHNQSLPKPQGLRERDDQFYLNDPVPQPGSRESGYRRVVHVQALDDRQSHRTERYSEGRESRIGPSDHAVPPPKQFQLQRQGGDQELPKNYLVNDSYSQSFKPTLLEPRQYKSRVNEGSSSFRRPDETWQYNDDSPFAHDSERKWRRCAEIVLPSIERDLSDADHQPKSFPDQTKQDPYLLQEDFNPRPRQHSEPFFTEFEGYQESPHSKRRRIADEQRFETHRADKTILVPLERIEDRPSMYGTPVEAVYSAGMRNVASDTGIAPLPSMKVARSPTSLRQVNTFGQPAQMDRQVILEERQQKHVLPRNHFQIPLSRNREKPQISLHAVHAPLKYHNDSPTILETSHFAPTYYENFDLHSPSRHDISAIPIDDRAFVKSREALQSTQWCGESQRSIPSQFEDLSVNYRQHQKYGNDMSRDPQTESGLHAVDTAAADDHEYSRQSIGGYLHKADLGRQGAVVNLGPAPHRMQPQPIWTVKRDVPTSGQQHSGTGRINPLETQGSGLESRSGEQDLYGDDTLADILIAKNANMQARKQYSSMSYGIMNSVRTETMAPMRQRKGPSDIVVLD